MIKIVFIPKLDRDSIAKPTNREIIRAIHRLAKYNPPKENTIDVFIDIKEIFDNK